MLREKGTKAGIDYLWKQNEFFSSSVRTQRALDELLTMGYDYDFWKIKKKRRSLTPPPAISRLDEIKLPALIVTSEYDMKPCVEIAEILEKGITGSKLISIKDAGHVMNMDKPKEFNRELIAFIESQ